MLQMVTRLIVIIYTNIESLCCASETKIMLCINYTSIKKKRHLRWAHCLITHKYAHDVLASLEYYSNVTERCGVQLLTVQKSINRPGWWKGKFASFQMPATGRGGRTSVQRLTPFPPPPALTRRRWELYRLREGATCRNSTVSSDSHLQIGHWWSDKHHLGYFAILFLRA